MDFNELFSNPSMLHAAIVHLPIAGAVFGLILIGVSACFHRNNAVRAVTALVFLLMSAAAYVAIETGETARGEVPPTIPGDVANLITEHASHAQNVLYAGLFTLVCLLISLIRVDTIRIAGLLLAAAGAIAANIFVAQTGHLGGKLVYNHGVGTPLVHLPAAAPAAEPIATLPAEPVPAEPGTEGAPPAPEMAPETPGEPAPVTPVEAAALVDDAEWVAIHEFTMEEAAKISFTRDIWPIIDDQCIVCHEEPDPDGEFIMTTLADIMKGGKKTGPGVIPGDPDESPVVKYIRGIYNPRMPEDEDPLPEDMLHKIRMWIAAGAIDDGQANGAPATAPADAAPAEEMKEEAAAPAESAPAEEKVEETAPASAPAEEMKEESTATEAAPAETTTDDAATTTETAPAETASEDTTTSTETAPAETVSEDATTSTEAATAETTTDDTTTSTEATSTSESTEEAATATESTTAAQ